MLFRVIHKWMIKYDGEPTQDKESLNARWINFLVNSTSEDTI